MLPDLVQSVFAFINKLKLFKAHIQKGDLTHFSTLLQASGQVTSAALNKQRVRYATLLETLQESFVPRFRDLQLKMLNKQRVRYATLLETLQESFVPRFALLVIYN